MQSWGVQSRFTERDTGLDPSKSGVYGLLCAAQGLGREAADAWLRSLSYDLRMGVRVDQQGSLRYDFHTAQNVRIANASRVNLYKGTGLKDSVSRRYYLADAAFLVGLESDDLALLTQLHAALRDPVWPLFLGRKAFVPSPPIYLPDGLRKREDLLTSLKWYPFLGRGEAPRQLRLVLDDPENGEQVRPDQPISFAARRFAPRRVTTTFIECPPFNAETSDVFGTPEVRKE